MNERQRLYAMFDDRLMQYVEYADVLSRRRLFRDAKRQPYEKYRRWRAILKWAADNHLTMATLLCRPEPSNSAPTQAVEH